MGITIQNGFRQLHERQQFFETRVLLSSRPVVQNRRQQDIFANSHMWQEGNFLDGVTDAFAQGAKIASVQSVAQRRYRATIRNEKADDQLNQC